MKKSVSCPSCNSKKTKIKHKISNSRFSEKGFSVFNCCSCLVDFTYPIPNKKEIKKYYDPKTYQSFKFKKNTFFDLVYGWVQKINTLYKVSVLKLNNKYDVLDYGSGSGDFVNHLNKRGYSCYGYEPINKVGGFVFNNKQKIINKKFDLITLWHVLEHTHEPHKTLLFLKGLLKKNGRIVVGLPNTDSYDNTFYDKDWAAYDVPRHLFHFNRSSFDIFIKKSGLKIHSTHPMYFDAFYVSMLSEKNKNNSFWFISGFVMGCVSNLCAVFTKKHSSIIYIIG